MLVQLIRFTITIVNPRAELVRLISNGIPTPDIVEYFVRAGLSEKAIEHLLHQCGVQFRKHRRFEDGITDERRAYLQELSTLDD